MCCWLENANVRVSLQVHLLYASLWPIACRVHFRLQGSAKLVCWEGLWHVLSVSFNSE